MLLTESQEILSETRFGHEIWTTEFGPRSVGRSVGRNWTWVMAMAVTKAADVAFAQESARAMAMATATAETVAKAAVIANVATVAVAMTMCSKCMKSCKNKTNSTALSGRPFRGPNLDFCQQHVFVSSSPENTPFRFSGLKNRRLS